MLSLFSGNKDLSLQLTGNATVVPSPYGYQGLHLPSGDLQTYIQISEHSTFQFPRGFTIEAVLATDTDAQEIIYSNSHFRLAFFNEDLLRIGVFTISGFHFGNVNLTAINSVITPARIHYYVVTYTPNATTLDGELKIYVDGELMGTQTIPDELYYEETTVYIGGEKDHQHQNMTLFVMRVSNRPKLAEEIAAFGWCK